jgi:hypothetical protein
MALDALIAGPARPPNGARGTMLSEGLRCADQGDCSFYRRRERARQFN